jgi:hypothetical protein
MGIDMKQIYAMLSAVFLSLAVMNAASAAVVTFTNTIADTDASSRQVTFDEFAVGDSVGPGATPVPGNGAVTLSASRSFSVGDLSTSSIPQTPGLFENNFIFQPTGSSAAGSFFVDFASPVAEAGLVLYNNFSIDRNYILRAFDSDGVEIAEELDIGVGANAEFLGFLADMAIISRLELNFGPTFATGQRPLIDSITYVDGSAVTPVPVPAALPLFLSAIAGLAFAQRRRRTQ